MRPHITIPPSLLYLRILIIRRVAWLRIYLHKIKLENLSDVMVSPHHIYTGSVTYIHIKFSNAHPQRSGRSYIL